MSSQEQYKKQVHDHFQHNLGGNYLLLHDACLHRHGEPEVVDYGIALDEARIIMDKLNWEADLTDKNSRESYFKRVNFLFQTLLTHIPGEDGYATHALFPEDEPQA